MNIEKINALYNSMVELSTILTEEGDNAVFAINGLRLASAEFRSAYFKVLDTLNACPISKKETNSSEVADIPEEASDEDINEVVEEDDEDSSKLAFVHVSDEPKKPKKPSSIMMDHQRSIEEFVTENYEFTDEDSRILIRDIIFKWGKAVNQQLRRQHYKSLGDVLKQIFTNDGEYLLGLKPKCTEENVEEPVKEIPNPKVIKNDDKYEKVKNRILNKDSVPLSGTYYFHPKYTKFGVDEKGNPVIKKDNSLQPHHFRDTSKGPVIHVGRHVVISARKFAYECYVGKEMIGRTKVSVLNGNKMDLSRSNLAIKGEKAWHETLRKYYKDDVIYVCEYIQKYGNIKNIEKDSSYRIGYHFAKQIFQKESYRTISDKYF